MYIFSLVIGLVFECSQSLEHLLPHKFYISNDPGPDSNHTVGNTIHGKFDILLFFNRRVTILKNLQVCFLTRGSEYIFLTYSYQTFFHRYSNTTESQKASGWMAVLEII